jgi:hypothetical protein
MPSMEWRPALCRKIEALNDTAEIYRSFDCAEEDEFLSSGVRRTVEEGLPCEIYAVMTRRPIEAEVSPAKS